MKKVAFMLLVFGIAGLIGANLAFSATLALVDGASMEVRLFDPPGLPFTYDPDHIDISLNNALGFILSKGFGVTTESFLGPGVTSWEGKQGVDFYDNAITAGASAVGTVAGFLDPLLINDAQYVKDIWLYAGIYELIGNPGESANISLDYELEYNYFNIAAGGRAKSEVAAGFYPWIIPADKTWKYGDNAANNYLYGSNPWLDLTQYSESFTYENDVEYTWMGGFEDINRVKAGSLDLGTMNVGDRLYFWGTLGAVTTCEVYSTGLSTATSFTTFEGYFNTDDSSPPNPVPEPTTILLLGIGLIGMAGVKKTFKK